MGTNIKACSKRAGSVKSPHRPNLNKGKIGAFIGAFTKEENGLETGFYTLHSGVFRPQVAT